MAKSRLTDKSEFQTSPDYWQTAWHQHKSNVTFVFLINTANYKLIRY